MKPGIENGRYACVTGPGNQTPYMWRDRHGKMHYEYRGNYSDEFVDELEVAVRRLAAKIAKEKDLILARDDLVRPSHKEKP